MNIDVAGLSAVVVEVFYYKYFIGSKVTSNFASLFSANKFVF